MLTVKLNRPALRKALARENLTQRELAEKIGFSKSQVSHVFVGRREPSARMRRSILEQLNEYSFDDLFTIEESKNDD